MRLEGCEWLRLMAFHGAGRRFRRVGTRHRPIQASTGVLRVSRSTVWVSGWLDPNPKGLVVRGVSDTVVTYILRRSFLNISKLRNS